MAEQLVALFEGDAQGSGLRLLARTRDPQLVGRVRRWFVKQRRDELARLSPEGKEPEGALGRDQGKPRRGPRS